MSGLMARSKQGLASSKGRPSPLLAWPMVVVISVTLASTHSSTLLINYQSGVGGGGGGNGLGLLPNGYNVAASNSAMNQQMLQQQQQQQQQQHQQQQQDPNQYHPSDQTGSQTQAQDQYAPQASPIAPQQNSGSNHLLQQYSNSMRNNNNLANQQQQQQQPQQQQSASLGGGSSSGSGSGISERETGPIFRLQGSAMNGSSVKLVWSIERGYSADSFEIKYGPIPNHEVFTLALNGSAREATINSLQPDTLYQFTLWGYSDDNGGGGSGGAHIWRPRLITIKTPKLNDQGQAAGTMRQLAEDGQITPLGVKAEAKSNQSIQLSWTEQERPASLQNLKRINIIRYYVVNNNSTQGAAGLPQQTEPYSSSSSSSSQANSSAVQVGSSIKYHYLNVTEMQNRDNRIIIQKLKPATEYAFAVKTAYVSPDTKKTYRHSGFSMDTSARTFDLEPSAPRNFSIQPMQLTSDEIKAGTTIPKLELTWSAPESPNGQLRGYVILYAHEVNLPDDKWFRIPVNDSNINNWYVANLRPGASYYFKMRAINQRGQSPDTETRLFIATPSPSAGQQPSFSSPHPQQPTLAPSQPIGGGGMIGAPIPPNNILLMIVLCLIAIFFILFLVVSCLVCRSRSNGRSSKGRRKGSLQLDNSNSNNNNKSSHNSNDLNGDSFASSLNNNNNSSQSSTVAGRVGTLARRSRLQQNDHHLTNSNNNSKPDFWISAMDQQQAIAAAAAAAANSSEIKSNISEKSGSDINMAAMVSIQRDSPQQFTTQTTQLAPILPEYRFAANGQQQLAAEQQLMQQIQQQQQQGHYHTGHHHQFGGTIGFDQMDNANAALMTLTKRQQQQLQKYQIQFASTAGATMGPHSNHQAPSPHQQPPPPPPLNIEQQQHQQQQQNQSLYGTHQQSGTAAHLNNTRSLRLHRPTLYDPVSGSFVQQDTPPNYNSHLNSMLNGVHHQLQSFNNNNQQQQTNNTVTSGSNTLQFHHHPHQTSTLMSRRSTNTLRSFQSGGGGLYGQLGGQFAAPPVPPTSGNGGGPPHLLQNHQAVINQLNHPSLPLKHVSAVRPQIMSSLEDQIEMELAEKQAEQQHLQSQQQQQQQSQQQQQQQQQHGPPSMVQQQD